MDRHLQRSGYLRGKHNGCMLMKKGHQRHTQRVIALRDWDALYVEDYNDLGKACECNKKRRETLEIACTGNKKSGGNAWAQRKDRQSTY